MRRQNDVPPTVMAWAFVPLRWCVTMTIVAALLGVGARVAGGQAREDEHGGHDRDLVHFEISCSDGAQMEFNEAVALLHHMTYPRAREAFQRIAASDSTCAMAHWGIAMTLFQPLWPTRPGPAELQRGWEAARRASALAPRTERERRFVEAVLAFFRDPASSDYWRRIRDWEQALERTYRAFPEDPEAAAFYALAHLAVAPTTQASSAHSERAAELLLEVYERNPDHPGAMHYLVHANDAPGRERESLQITRRYEMVAPGNPHAHHMPTHIYTRIGDWDAVVRGNVRAAEAALTQPAGDAGQFVWDEFPHAIEYLVYAHLQKGDDEEAGAQLQRLVTTARLEPTFKTAFHRASTPARYALERRDWNAAKSLVPRQPATLDWDRFRWAEAVTWFARGLGAARTDDVDAARTACDRLLELESATVEAGEDLFARNIRILRLGVLAWLAHAMGDGESAVALMREATELEASTPKHAVTPAPTLPAPELLGDLLLAQGHPAEALAAYERSLASHPGRFNSLLGAARAARASGNDDASRGFYRELAKLAERSSRQAILREARTFAQSPP